jgi:hypothetical protein
MITMPPRGGQRAAYALGVLACLIFIVMVFFKFLPDVGTSVVQGKPSVLTSWQGYEAYYLTTNSVFRPRFLGNISLYALAEWIAPHALSSDLRLHPLRIAATLCTMFWFLLALAPAHLMARRIDWQVYLPGLAAMFMTGLYVFYPCDAPSLAWITLSMVFLLNEQLHWAFLCMLVTGLFRESAFHMVVLVGMWALVAQHQPFGRRAFWVVLFAVAFVVEYKLIRVWYPGEERGLDYYRNYLLEYPRELFFGTGLWSLTTLMTLPLAVMYPLAWWFLKRREQTGWVQRFFLLNCLAFPGWILFYRLQGGNINEFRIMWPFIMPCLLGLAWREEVTSQPQAAAAS